MHFDLRVKHANRLQILRVYLSEYFWSLEKIYENLNFKYLWLELKMNKLNAITPVVQECIHFL